MKKLFLFIILFWVVNARSQHSAGNFILQGKIIGQTSGKIRLYYTSKANQRASDSATVSGSGHFRFKGLIGEPSMAYLDGNSKTNSRNQANTVDFFLEPGIITISLKKGDFKNAVIRGSKTQLEYATLQKSHEPIQIQMKPLEDSYTKAAEAYQEAIRNKESEKKLDSMKEKLASMHDEFEPYNNQIALLDYNFFASHPNSYVTPFYLQFYVSRLSLDSLQLFYNSLSDSIRLSNAGNRIAKEIKKLKAGSPGNAAEDFTANDINGNKLTLSSFKGKFVLIDFWASWCVPCRHSSPHLLELYKQYHDEGLDIIGVADDDSKPEEWKKAVAKDGVGVWHHVLRGLDMKKIMSGQDNPKDISEKFGIHELPTKILIDKNGVIVGRYDKGTDEEVAEMDKKIGELLSN